MWVHVSFGCVAPRGHQQTQNRMWISPSNSGLEIWRPEHQKPSAIKENLIFASHFKLNVATNPSQLSVCVSTVSASDYYVMAECKWFVQALGWKADQLKWCRRVTRWPLSHPHPAAAGLPVLWAEPTAWSETHDRNNSSRKPLPSHC